MIYLKNKTATIRSKSNNRPSILDIFFRICLFNLQVNIIND